jgi:hypothetical protein
VLFLREQQDVLDMYLDLEKEGVIVLRHDIEVAVSAAAGRPAKSILHADNLYSFLEGVAASTQVVRVVDDDAAAQHVSQSSPVSRIVEQHLSPRASDTF